MKRALILLPGVLLVAISLLIRFTTSVTGTAGTLSLSTANGLCSSPLGLIARSGSAHVRSVCAQTAAAEDACGVLLIAGLLFLAAGAARLIYKSRQAS